MTKKEEQIKRKIDDLNERSDLIGSYNGEFLLYLLALF